MRIRKIKQEQKGCCGISSPAAIATNNLHIPLYFLRRLRVTPRLTMATLCIFASVICLKLYGRHQGHLSLLNSSNLSEQVIPNSSTSTKTLKKSPDNSGKVDISVVLLTYNQIPGVLERLLESILEQKKVLFELIIADNGCQDSTVTTIMKIINTSELVGNSFLVGAKYIQQCDNPGYGQGNNQAVRATDPSSQWILFLNDDIILNNGFLSSLHKTTLRQSNYRALGFSPSAVGAVGCKLVSEDGTELLEAGSLIWKNAVCAGYGRGNKNPQQAEFQYVRPVDYVSGACLMVNKTDFLNYGGFDSHNFKAYYEDTDLQMHIQHDLKKETLFQPLAVANHIEHGTFSAHKAINLMQEGQIIFERKWHTALQQEHMDFNDSNQIALLHARDSRRKRLPKILYIDDGIPNPSVGSGFGRAFNNLIVIARLGFPVSAATLPVLGKDCGGECISFFQQEGIELFQVPPKSERNPCYFIEELLASRPKFYSIIITSRPNVFEVCEIPLLKHCNNNYCSLVYDAEALWYRRDEMFLDMAARGFVSKESIDRSVQAIQKNLEYNRGLEQDHVQKANIIVTVSEKERKEIAKLLQNRNIPIYVIGHALEASNVAEIATFEDRNGILFLGAFHNNMYYNGDAIWHFIVHVYPLIIAETVGNEIPLVIAGRDIPDYLLQVVSGLGYESFITFIESPPDVKTLFDKCRVFVAGHLYGTGIQFKVRINE
jgi:GT2 family glycosyltransferase